MGAGVLVLIEGLLGTDGDVMRVKTLYRPCIDLV